MPYAMCDIWMYTFLVCSVQCVPRAPSVAAGQKAHTQVMQICRRLLMMMQLKAFWAGTLATTPCKMAYGIWNNGYIASAMLQCCNNVAGGTLHVARSTRKGVTYLNGATKQ